MSVGDESFEAMFRAEMSSVVTTVYRITNDLAMAEDVAQDAFAKALARWRRIRRYDRPGAWVRRVAIRDAVRVASRAQRNRPLNAEHVTVVVDGDVADPALMSALRVLPPQQRAAVALYYLEDRPASEVADSLGCTEPTVRSHLRRARGHLADALGEVDDEGAMHDVRH